MDNLYQEDQGPSEFLDVARQNKTVTLGYAANLIIPREINEIWIESDCEPKFHAVEVENQKLKGCAVTNEFVKILFKDGSTQFIRRTRETKIYMSRGTWKFSDNSWAGFVKDCVIM